MLKILVRNALCQGHHNPYNVTVLLLLCLKEGTQRHCWIEKFISDLASISLIWTCSYGKHWTFCYLRRYEYQSIRLQIRFLLEISVWMRLWIPWPIGPTSFTTHKTPSLTHADIQFVFVGCGKIRLPKILFIAVVNWIGILSETNTGIEVKKQTSYSALKCQAKWQATRFG